MAEEEDETKRAQAEEAFKRKPLLHHSPTARGRSSSITEFLVKENPVTESPRKRKKLDVEEEAEQSDPTYLILHQTRIIKEQLDENKTVTKSLKIIVSRCLNEIKNIALKLEKSPNNALHEVNTKLERMEQNIDEIKNAVERKQSYSSAVIKNVPTYSVHPQATNTYVTSGTMVNELRQQYKPKIIIKDQDASIPSSQLANKVQSSLPSKGTGVIPAFLRQSGANSVTIGFKSDEDKTKFKNAITASAALSTVVVEEPHKLKPKMIIKKVPSVIQKERLIEEIHAHNPDLFEGNKDDIRLAFAMRTKNPDIYNAVIEVSPKTRLQIKQKGSELGLFYHWLQISDFSPVKVCFKCQGFGHSSKTCQSKRDVCPTCSGEHRNSECPARNDKTQHCCINCQNHNATTKGKHNYDTRHRAFDTRNCPTFKAVEKRMEERIDYGYEQ